MPTARSTTYKIVTGSQNQATIDAATAIEDFAKQTDQGNVPWGAPDHTRSTIPEATTYVTALDGTRVAVGSVTFKWVFLWTNDMLTYWLTNYITAESETVSVKAFDYQCRFITLH